MRVVSPLPLAAVAMALAVAIFLPLTIHGIGYFDEGFISSGAMMILRGDWPLRDFFVIYGPGQFYFTAGLYAVFGENLLVSRLAHLVFMVALAGLVAITGQTLADHRRRLAALGVLAFLLIGGLMMPNPGYPAVPALMLLIGSAWPASRWVASGDSRALLLASLLVGVAGMLRWDFAVLGLAAHAALVAAVRVVCRTSFKRWACELAVAIAPGAGLVALVFLPFVLAEGLERWFREVPLFLFLEFKRWRELDMLAPTLADLVQAVHARSLWDAAQSLNRLVYAATPFVFIPAAALIALRRLGRRGEAMQARDGLALALSLLALVMLNQVRVRAAAPQAFPAFVAALPLVGYTLAAMPSPRSAWVCRALLTLVFLALPAYALQGSLRLFADRATVRSDIPRAGVVLEAGSAPLQRRMSDYAALIRHVRSVTAPGEPIFSGVTDTSLLFSNDAMVYFLADRPSATRWIEMEPGLTNTVRGQQEVIEELRSHRVRTVVLWPRRSTEKNATSVSNGVHLLDDFLRTEFRPSRRFGDYTVLEKLPP